MNTNLSTRTESGRLVVCLGAAKAGTSTLFQLLRSHPQVAGTRWKETGFFHNPTLWCKGYAWFLDTCVERKDDARVVFECDPSYLLYPQSWTRMLEVDPLARMIVLLRNPIDRAYSHYQYRRANGWKLPDFETALADEVQRRKDGTADEDIHSYIARGLYAERLEALFAAVPSERIYIILFEDLVKDQTLCMRSLQRWLGLTEHDLNLVHANPTTSVRMAWLGRLLNDPTQKALLHTFGTLIPNTTLRRNIVRILRSINQSSSRTNLPKLDQETRKRLCRIFEADIARTEKLIGRDLSAWRR